MICRQGYVIQAEFFHRFRHRYHGYLTVVDNRKSGAAKKKTLHAGGAVLPYDNGKRPAFLTHVIQFFYYIAQTALRPNLDPGLAFFAIPPGLFAIPCQRCFLILPPIP